MTIMIVSADTLIMRVSADAIMKGVSLEQAKFPIAFADTPKTKRVVPKRSFNLEPRRKGLTAKAIIEEKKCKAAVPDVVPMEVLKV